MERFRKVTLNIQNFKSGHGHASHGHDLVAKAVSNSLCKKPAVDLDQLRQKAAKYMQLEELRGYKSQAKAEESGEKGKDKKKEHLNQPAVSRGDRHRENRGPRFTTYTPLSVDRGKF